MTFRSITIHFNILLMLSFCLKLLHTYVYKYIYDVKKIIFEEFLSSICLSNWQWV